MKSAGLTQHLSDEQGSVPKSIACILCLRDLKATVSHSITAFSLNQEPALTGHDSLTDNVDTALFNRYP